MELKSKTIISGELEVLTGLHIGGSSTSMNIGEVDLNVIKSPQNGEPIIPGSSLKGKLRSLLAKAGGHLKIEDDSDDIKNLFGAPDKKVDDKTISYITRLIVRDSFLVNSDEIKKWEKEGGDYTEVKWENTINRTKGSAENPRQLERVPKGAKFKYEMIIDVYDNEGDKYRDLLLKAMNLLEDDYLGGNGSRGYGKIKFNSKKIVTKKIGEYANCNS